MNTTITINSKVFNKVKSPTPSSVVLRTTSRGETLPDFLTVSHKETKNPVEPGSMDTRSLVRFDRTFITSAGLVKQVSYMLQAVIPSNVPAADSAAVLADLTDFMASAITLRTANVAIITNHEVA